MTESDPRPFICLPGSVLAALADGCTNLGDPGVDALREAGRLAGWDIYDALDSSPASLSLGTFWSLVNEKLRELNLGTLRYEPLDGGLGAVGWQRLPEAGSPPGGERFTEGCHLATGLLAGLLSRGAGRPVAVLEIGCGARASHDCWFLVGAETRLIEISERLTAGASVSEALEAA